MIPANLTATFHDLRHTPLTKLAESGLETKPSRRSGHTEPYSVKNAACSLTLISQLLEPVLARTSICAGGGGSECTQRATPHGTGCKTDFLRDGGSSGRTALDQGRPISLRYLNRIREQVVAVLCSHADRNPIKKDHRALTVPARVRGIQSRNKFNRTKKGHLYGGYQADVQSSFCCLLHLRHWD